MNILSTFDGDTAEDLFAHLVCSADVTVVAEQNSQVEGHPLAVVAIHQATDDQGVTWYAITDGADGAEVVIDRAEAWEVAVEFASHVADEDNPWDWARDERIPARAHPDGVALSA